MKTVLIKILTLSSLVLLMLSACKKNDAIVTSNGGNAGTLSTTTTAPILASSRLNDTSKIIKFTYTNANYGFSAVVSSTLQIDKVSDNWANPTSVTFSTGVVNQGYSTADFNNLLLKLGVAGGTTGQFQARIMYSISSSVTPIYSNTVAFTATPFNLTSWLYVVGGFNGYNTATADSLISSTGNGIYTGVINFTTGGSRFLVLPARNYNNKYATTTNPPGGTAQSLTYATEYVTGGGNDLYAPSAPGYYFITLNINTNTITVTQTNTYSAIGTTAADPGSYSVDVPLTKYVNDGVTGWTSVVAFKAGDFKIRQNNDWTFSWGIPKATSEGDGIPNTLNNTSNNNIPIPVAGNYAVSFNITPFALGASPSGSIPPSKTATYKLVKQ